MIYLAGVLLLIFILHLIDKHNRWKQSIKLTVALVVLAVVGYGGLFGWAEYSDYREAQQAKQQAALDAVNEAACMARLTQMPVPTDADASKVPQDIHDACAANSAATQYFYTRIYKPPLGVKFDPPTRPSPPSPVFGWATVAPRYTTADVYNYCYFAAVGSTSPMESCDFGNTSVATLNKGDRVQLLSNLTRAPSGDNIYKVKFQRWTGWMDSTELTVETQDKKKE